MPTDQGHDHRGRAKDVGDELAHVGNPPRAEDDPLSCRFHAIADRVERRVGQLGRAVPEEGGELPVEVARRGHAVRSCEAEDVLASASRPARSACFA